MGKRLAKIEISKECISEYDRNRKIVIIPRESIEKVSLEYGFSEERPIMSILFGLVSLLIGFALGLMPISKMLFRTINGEQVLGNLGIFVFAIPLLLIGAWLIMRSLSYGHYLRVTTTKATRKLSFEKRVEREAITSFIKECNRTLGYDILYA
jgi:hypothetical protein